MKLCSTAEGVYLPEGRLNLHLSLALATYFKSKAMGIFAVPENESNIIELTA